MKIKFILFLLIISNNIFSQKVDYIKEIFNNNWEQTKFGQQITVDENFSKIWAQTENYNIFGIIGDDCERLRIKLISVKRNPKNHNEYFVIGKSKVKNVIDDFTGKITIEKIYKTKYEHFGADDELKNQVKLTGLIIANYQFFENKKQKHSGKFTGKLYSKFYFDNNNILKYDDINAQSDGYLNNAFVGNWTMYNSNISKNTKWGDYRVPLSPKDFDIGASEFSPSEKYMNNGWQSYHDILFTLHPNPKSLKIEKEIWWK